MMSTTGFSIFLGSSLISWKCKKQGVVSKSSAESEYLAISHTTIEIIFHRWSLGDFGVQSLAPLRSTLTMKVPRNLLSIVFSTNEIGILKLIVT